jgi:hypothetical protein
MTNRKIIVVPCIVNSWLNCSSLKNCVPGFASSVRMNSASSPATAKKM